MRESRSEGTARVTAAVIDWLWRQGRCALALEVGLHATRGLCTPWDGRWRVDVAAAVERNSSEAVHVIEVKGSPSDIAREDMTAGKWIVPYPRLGLTPWLAVAHTIAPAAYEHLNADWGILVVDDRRVRREREPGHVVKTTARAPNDDVTFAYRALARVLTNQALPVMAGLSQAQARRELVRQGAHRPWRHWQPEGRIRERVIRDEDTNIL